MIIVIYSELGRLVVLAEKLLFQYYLQRLRKFTKDLS
jgi:hypothetical protein